MSFPVQILIESLNGFLQRTDWGEGYLDKLSGQVILFTITDMSIDYRLSVKTSGISLASERDPVTLSVTGNLRDYMALAYYTRRGESLPAGLVEVSGDLSIMQDLQCFFSSVGVGFEEILASSIGDVGTHKIIRLHERFCRSMEARSWSILEDMREFLVFEINLLPCPEDIAEMEDEIHQVAEAVNSIESRVKRLLEGHKVL